VALELLRRVAAFELPCSIADPGEIVLLRALRAAGLVQASIPQLMRVNGYPYQQAATVHLVTRQGWDALNTLDVPLTTAGRKPSGLSGVRGSR
jgi:hypothetical protein